MTELISRPTHTGQQTLGYTYTGEALRHVAMPLGGIGAGQIALGGDGGLRQWQIVNQINHLGFVPDSFFALRTLCTEPPVNEIRVLQSREVIDLPQDHTPLVNDDYIPSEQRALLQKFPGVERTTFTGAYPFAQIAYEDAKLPVAISLEAYSPFVPLDAENSGLPAIIFTFMLRNRWTHGVNGCLGAALQNAVGWDGLTPITGNRCPLYGGNANRVRRRAEYTSIVMENPTLPEDHPGAGQMALTSMAPGTRVYERWTTAEQFIRFIEGFNPDRRLDDPQAARNAPLIASGVSPVGETWNGGLIAPFRLAPGEAVTITFIISWYFPNRYLNFDQFGGRRDYGKSKFWLGNAYATRFADALDVTEYVIQRRQSLEETARKWSECIYRSTLPDWLAELLAVQGTLMRSPTTFWTADGRFYGFEGSLGASTAMWNGNFGGSCPLNCTHVWNYEMALSRLFPELERSMRETDFEQVQAPEGYIPHRTVLPLYLRQFWDEPIGGPTNPAIDGMLGAVLKTYREVRQGAGREWLNRLWPRVKRLMAYIIARWDENNDGVLEGEQPNTYDIAFYGPNMYIGALWLAALRAAEEMAKIQGESDLVQQFRQLFERGSVRYDELLWNGEYYIQLLDETTPREDQFGEGCLADQLFGQWWAHLLDQGYILPREHVRTALQSIIKYNMRHGFHDFEHIYRVFADRDDGGLLVCTWPHGGRPSIPVRYCDEVWTGMEYHVGALCIMEGFVEEGMNILHALRCRYNGTRRNPYNEIECGDHYARAMSGWSVLEAISGFHYNALDDALAFAPAITGEEFRAPFITASSWGVFEQSKEGVRLACSYGDVSIRSLSLSGSASDVTVTLDGTEIAAELQCQDNSLLLTFEKPLLLKANSTLEILIHS
jgi:non-lysosomal glucosylceramidase